MTGGGDDGPKSPRSPAAHSVDPTPHAPPSSPDVDDLVRADTMLDSGGESTPRSLGMGDMLADRYRLLSELGRGGEGVVYRALDTRADTVVALKLLVRDPTRLGRYRRELQMARKVTHPNVVRIHDLVDLPGRFGLSMELVEGEPLDARIARTGRLPADELLSMAHDLASALGAAHGAGVTHRDLKPANVILRANGRGAVVTDFGIARLHGAADATTLGGAPGDSAMRLTTEGALVGTPFYMAPEQLDGRTDIGPPADVYAFGLVVREAATGVRVHGDVTNLGDLRAARRERPPKSLAQDRPDLPIAFSSAIDRCLSLDIGNRYADGRALLAALEPRRASLRPSQSPSARHRSLGLTVALAAASIAAAGLVVLRWVRPPPPLSAAASTTPSPPAPLTLHTDNAHRITFGEGCQEFPSLSPDGDTLVYDGTVGADSYVYALRLSDGVTRPVTHVEGWDFAAAISPDGGRIAFLRMAAREQGTYVVDVEGKNEPRRVLPGQLHPSWSPDGKAVWAGEQLVAKLVDVDSGEIRDTEIAPTGSRMTRLIDATDLVLGSFINDRESGKGGIGAFGRDHTLRWLLEGDVEETLALAPDGHHALTSRVRVTQGVELVAFPLDGGPEVSLASSNISARKGLAVSHDGRRLVWSTCTSRSGVTRLRAGRLDPLPGGGDWEDFAVAVIGRAGGLAVLSSRGGPVQPWIVDPTQRQIPKVVRCDDAQYLDLDASPDGTTLVLQSDQGLRLARVDGNAAPVALTRGSDDFAARFLHDGSEVLFTRRVSEAATQVLAVSIGGGEPRTVIEGSARWAVPSPVDDRLAYLAGDEAHALVPRLRDLRSGRDTALSGSLGPDSYNALAWSPDGRRLAVVRRDQEVVQVDVASGRALSTFRGDDAVSLVRYVGPDLYVVRQAWAGGLWIADATWK